MLQHQLGNVTLVFGGVRSGKSRFAQRIAERKERVTLVVTAERRDDAEMHTKIKRHRADQPQFWATIEESLYLAQTIREAGKASDLLLIDCLTLFASVADMVLLMVAGQPFSLKGSVPAEVRP